MHILTLLRVPSRWMSDYKEVYLYSDRWKRKRAAVITRDGNRCTRCGADNKTLHVHHKTYRFIGREPLRDLITLCEDCHRKEHGK